MRTKKAKKIVASVLAAFMICAALLSVLPLLVNAAEEETLSYPISGYNPGEDCYDPIPMLVIMINFDADGDGVDDNPDTGDPQQNYITSQKVKNKNDPAYGEQWCHATEADWVSRLFSYEGNTLNTYYKHMSNDKFYWIPATETYGEANNGVIAVTIDNVHPDCNGVSENWLHCFNQIVEAASEYVDFSDFDANSSGRLEKYELCLALILGGAETSSGQTGLTEVYGFHAYYKDFDMNNVVNTDGVEIGRSGFFGTGAISGGHALNFGVFAHELGHYLGAPDLYDTKDTKYDNAVGAVSLMASGAHGSSPSHLDPYMLSNFGFCAPTTVFEDGTYTLYSKSSSEGEYNVIKLCTPDPGEYYLIENRNSSIKDGSTFDNGISQGIIIWHIDENIHGKTGNTCNSATHGYDPAVVAYTPLKEASSAGSALTSYGAFMANHSMYANYAMFKPSSYSFPVSKTWYTSMTAEQAALVEDLCVEVLSRPGDEMQIKITGSYKLEIPPEISLYAYDWTKTSVKIRATIETLNYSTLTNATFTIKEKATGTVIKEEPIKFNADYACDVLCDGLKAGTNYEYSVTGESSHGEFTVKDSNYTKFEEVEQVTVTLVINSDHLTTQTQKVNVGSELKIRINPTKYGYTLAGWYLDEAYTQPYTPGIIEEAGDFTIYAKWEKNQAPAQTTGAKPTTTAPVQTTTEPVQGGETPGTAVDPTVIVVASVAAVVLVGGGVAVAVVSKKSGKKN